MSTDTLAIPTLLETTKPEHSMRKFIADLAGNLGVETLPPSADGHCEVTLDDTRSLSIWALPDLSGVLLKADLPWPPGVDRQSVQRRALGFCLGAATINAPVIGLAEDGDLSLLWSLAAREGDDYAAAAITAFLESLGEADAALAGTSLPQVAKDSTTNPEASTPSPAVLEAIAQTFGMDRLDFDGEGFVTCQSNDGSLVLLQHLVALRRIAVLAQLGTVCEGEDEVYQSALEFNDSAMTERQSVLGMDVDRGGLFLVTTLGATENDVAEVEPALELFIHRFAECRGEVFDPDYLEEGVEDEETRTAEPSTVALSAVGIRV